MRFTDASLTEPLFGAGCQPGVLSKKKIPLWRFTVRMTASLRMTETTPLTRTRFRFRNSSTHGWKGKNARTRDQRRKLRLVEGRRYPYGIVERSGQGELCRINVGSEPRYIRSSQMAETPLVYTIIGNRTTITISASFDRDCAGWKDLLVHYFIKDFVMASLPLWFWESHMKHCGWGRQRLMLPVW